MLISSVWIVLLQSITEKRTRACHDLILQVLRRKPCPWLGSILRDYCCWIVFQQPFSGAFYLQMLPLPPAMAQQLCQSAAAMPPRGSWEPRSTWAKLQQRAFCFLLLSQVAAAVRWACAGYVWRHFSWHPHSALIFRAVEFLRKGGSTG